jgi:DNA-binding transcriptional LysR family regulator
LTAAGSAFLIEARALVKRASDAVLSAQQAGERKSPRIRLSHGDLGIYSSVLADFVSAFRDAHPSAELVTKDTRGADLRALLHSRRADVAASFVATWPLPGYATHLLFDCTITGVLLPLEHPLAAAPAVRLADLEDLTYLSFAAWRWPEMDSGVEKALRERRLVMRPGMIKAADVTPEIQIATGQSWTLASRLVGDYVMARAKSVVYRDIVDAPIPVWLALVSLEETSELELLAGVARTQGLMVAAPGTPPTAVERFLPLNDPGIRRIITPTSAESGT